MCVRDQVRDLLCASKGSAYTRRQATAVTSSLSDAERRAVTSAPEQSRKHGWLALSPHVQRLRSDPFCIGAFMDDEGARRRDCLELRDWFANTFDCSAADASRSTSRESFAAWCVFQQRCNSKKVYLPRKVVYAGMRAAGLVPTAADPALSPCASNEDLVTHAEYAKFQSSIRSFVRNASVVCPSVCADGSSRTLDRTQTEIARGIAKSPFSVLTGGAGTGKTTLLSELIRSCLSAGVTVVCLAPTHRAKKNLSKRLPAGVDVMTVDAFVRAKGDDRSAKRLLLVDEASMLDLEKTARLARKIMEAGPWQVCFAGDDGQLEPIDRGEVFRTAIYNGGAHVFKLERCYRAECGDLYDAQVAIRQGRVPETSASIDVQLFRDDTSVEKAVQKFVQETSGAQFIAWTNRTCDLINKLVQRKERGASSATGAPMVGDRVVYCGKNDLKRNLTNAMCGVVASVPSPHALSVDWEDGGCIDCATCDAPLAYCITVHKAQGSEYERVCVVATNVCGMGRSLDRRWLYTAVSRAKRHCTVISTDAVRAFAATPLQKRELIGINFRSAAENSMH